MSLVNNTVKAAPIGSDIITTDDVRAAGFDQVPLYHGGMLKVQAATVNGDLTVKGDSAFNLKPLALTTDVAAVSAAVGAAATFTVVAANGVAPYTYKWFHNGQPIAVKDNSTANTASLKIAKVAETDAGVYHVEVSDSADNLVVSKAGTLTVTAAAASGQ